MALIKDEKVYRNLQEQVYENTCDIKELLRMYGYHGPYTSTDIIPIDDLYNRAMYLIGTGMPYKVYQYSDITKRFTYIGDYNMDVGPEGPPGPQGPRGERGPDGKPASEILNIETYDVIYKKETTESKVRANFDDGHSNEFTVFAKNGMWDNTNIIPGKGIDIDYKFDDTVVAVSINDTVIDQEKLEKRLLSKQNKLIAGENISIVNDVISASGGDKGTGELPYIPIDPEAIYTKLKRGALTEGSYVLWLQAVQAGGFMSNRQGSYLGPTEPQHTPTFIQRIASNKVYEMIFVTMHDLNGVEIPPNKDNLIDKGRIYAIFKETNKTTLFYNKVNPEHGTQASEEFIAVELGFTSDTVKLAHYYGWDAVWPEYATVDITNVIKSDLSNHVLNTTMHTTQAEKDAWNAKLDTADLAGYATEAFVTNITNDIANDLNNTTNALNAEIVERGNEIARVEGLIPDITPLATKDAVNAVANELSTHTGNGTIHVTASDKVAWSQKVNQDQIADMATKTDLEDYVTSDTFNTTISSIDDELVAIRNDIPDVSEFVTGTQMGNYVAQELVPVSNRIGDVEDHVDTLIAFAQDVPNTYAKKSDIPDVSGKVDKITTTDTYARVYGITRGGAQSNYPITSAAVANTIVSRTSDGYILAADPTANNHVTNKKYVDDAIAAIPAPTDCVDLTTDQDIFGKKAFKEPYKLVEVAPPTPGGGNLYQGLAGFSGAGVVVLNSYMSINLAGSSSWRTGVDLSIVDTNGDTHNTNKAVRLYGSNSAPAGQGTVIISSATVQEIWLYVRSTSSSSARALWVQDGSTSAKVNTGRTVGKFPTAEGLQYEPVKLARGTDYNSNNQVIIGFGGNIDVYAIEIVFAGSSASKASDVTYEYKELATLEDIPDVSEFAKKSDIPDLTDYAKKTDLPDLTDYVKESELTVYAKKDEIPTNYVDLSTAQSINGKKTFVAGITAPNLTAQGTNQSTIYGSAQMVHTFADSTTLNLQYPVKTGNKTIATVDDIPTNYVATSGDQTINGDKTFTGGIDFMSPIYVNDSSTTTEVGASFLRKYENRGADAYTLELPSADGTIALTSDIPKYYKHHIILGRTDDTKFVAHLDLITTSSTKMDYAAVVEWVRVNAPNQASGIGCTGVRLSTTGTVNQIALSAYKYSGGDYIRVDWYNPQTADVTQTNATVLRAASVHEIK